MDPLPIAPRLGANLDVIRAAGLNAILRGPHGIGKSEYLEAYARDRGLAPYVLDLSLMEPSDLTGMPYLEEDGAGGRRTAFAPPKTLPPPGAPAMLILEELNRCDRSLRQPCLQLLSARRLNSYALPAACFVAACINPDDGDYEVEPLDPALESRFVLLDVCPEREAWIAWAESAELSPGVVRYVRRRPSAFERATPRAWEQAARLTEQALRAGWPIPRLAELLSRVLPGPAAKALALDLDDSLPHLDPEALYADPSAYLEAFQAFRARGRLDRIQAALADLAALIEERGRPGPDALEWLGVLLEEIPPDMGGDLRAIL